MGAHTQSSAQGKQSLGRCSSQGGVLSGAASGRWAERCSSCLQLLQVRGALTWDSSQRPGRGRAGKTILGSPRHPSCHDLCSTEPALGQGPGCCLGSIREGAHTFHEVPSTLLSPTARGQPHPSDEVAQCRADIGDDNGPIRMALCLSVRWDWDRGRKNSFGTCSQSMSSLQESPCLCPGFLQARRILHEGLSRGH